MFACAKCDSFKIDILWHFESYHLMAHLWVCYMNRKDQGIASTISESYQS